MEHIFKVLFSPSIIVGIGMSIICTLLGLNDNIHSPIMHFLYQHKEYICINILCLIICSFVFEHYWHLKDNQIKDLEKIIENKDKQLEQTHKILYNRYGEFAKFANGIRWAELLKKFVDGKAIVDSAQIYRIIRNKDRKRIVITLHYEKGYCKVGMDINALLQTKYILNDDVYKMFRRGVLRRWIRLKNEHLKNWEAAELYNAMSEAAKEICEIIFKRLKKINSIGVIEENDFSYYRLLSILSLLLTGGDKPIAYDEVSDKKEINQYLRRGKRTGVLGAVLLEDVFIFSHKGESKKKGRMYVSFYFEDRGEPYVSVFSVTPYNLSESRDFYEEIYILVDDFQRALNESRINNV